MNVRVLTCEWGMIRILDPLYTSSYNLPPENNYKLMVELSLPAVSLRLRTITLQSIGASHQDIINWYAQPYNILWPKERPIIFSFHCQVDID